ncbi:MAG: ABC transporter ATP-binding protein/permease [Coriobacteriales bacterium]|jgi:putative ABC transport system permease protein|nr:ABC transporter ATP-binding protein/permease [Coriobacteriales bacterium]
MLELQHIKKTYQVGDIETRALDDVSLAFREKEMVAILGASGSGKTTFLNIVGGLDRYDGGELLIKGRDTRDFKEKDWDAYRNNSIGFVFQNYNLISHLSIVANVELSMTLSGVGAAEKHRRAIKVLEDVGLKDHLHKRPNQLSGGQMQRVAIARALVNDPEILLCDEPTGALDSVTSVQIMDLIKEISKDRLVIMVTHNPLIAEQYAERTVRFADGKVLEDSKPYDAVADKEEIFSLKKTSMNFLTALNLSFNNIRTKKGRTFLTALASSIGIIGIAIILSLSNGFQGQVDSFQQDSMAGFPIIVSQTTMELDADTMAEQTSMMSAMMTGGLEFVDTDYVTPYDPTKNTITHTNKFTDKYLAYLQDIDPAICQNIGYTRIVGMNLLREVDGEVKPITVAAGIDLGGDSSSSGSAGGAASGMQSMMSSLGSTTDMGVTSYPSSASGYEGYLESHYDLLAGAYPSAVTDMVLVVDNENKVNVNTLKNLGFNAKDGKTLSFDAIVGTTLKLIGNNDFYIETEFGTYLPGSDYDKMYNSSQSTTLRISGIVRQNPDAGVGILSTGLVYSDDLVNVVVDKAKDSAIVRAQRTSSTNVMTMEPLTGDAKDAFISYLGGSATPLMILIYPSDFDAKAAVLDYLDAYNDDKPKDDQVIYNDLAGTISGLTGGIMSAITLVLIAFSAISLVVSLIMVAIITYTSVLERTKEIGILKSLGARRKDITRVFNAETLLIGLFSGCLGILVAWLATFPINSAIYNMTDLANVAQMNPLYSFILVVISTVLAVLGGYIPALMASRKNAVDALRTE